STISRIHCLTDRANKKFQRELKHGCMKRIFAFLCLTLFSLSSVADEAHFHKGYQLIRAKQYKEAIAVLTPLAEQGHADAQYWLGLSYRLGRPDQDLSDMESELYWYREAAQNQQPYALWRLGQGEYLSCQLLGSCEHKAENLEIGRASCRERRIDLGGRLT